MPNITWCDLPEDVSLWPGLPLSLSGDEVMPLDYHAGRSGWLLYGRGLDKQRLTQYQTKLGAAMVIVAAWCVEDYQVIRLAGSLTPRATRLAHEAQLDVAPLGKFRICARRGCWSWIWIPRRSRLSVSMKSLSWLVPVRRWLK
ncbi:phosphoserine phosphatase [Salmonella enterica subsp. enterica]|uniref:Phosphoserine phosphatase n=1 Tax=Salmonella enterica I TaxID=59201 RepID=A0A447PNG0_SALET|nr:phosphoserine phosphatase [Salmonella enterica subsp. enterica]